ncbi:two-component regulator propeller domain-containing protein [Acanthopleuribacter pedis]|uniref:histidine kinase n=1 Tax=Acanthopleuribacter pedis TaxID=442870 RepID=A0A8J7QR46_9BACT|nr:two-component regulator propeller domain-containing protein [Acanthopleuribacter pedis]MBO1322660.1 diguanylate cyclase [Acanthopleuribacter pedis]
MKDQLGDFRRRKGGPADGFPTCGRCFFWALLLLWWPTTTFAQIYPVKSLTIEDGLSHATVYEVVQDRHGFMWFATQNGLNRYDGLTFQSFVHDSVDPYSLSAKGISSMVMRPDGKLWLGTWGGGLELFDPDTFTFQHFAHDPLDPTSLSHNEVQALLMDRRGRLWIGTSRAGLNLYDASNQSFTRIDQGRLGLPGTRIWTLSEDRAGRIWVGTQRGLCFIEPGGTVHCPGPEQIGPLRLPHQQVRALIHDHQNTLWIGTESGLMLLNHETNRLVQPQLWGAAASDLLNNDVINTIYQDQQNVVWIGTMNSGLFRLQRGVPAPRADGAKVQKPAYEVRRFHYRPLDPGSLTQDDIRAIFQDRAGNLWIGTRAGGINRINLSSLKFELYRVSVMNTVDPALNRITAVIPDDEDRFWLGTTKGLIRYQTDRAFQEIFVHDPADPNSLSHNRVLCLLRTRDGDLWAGTWEGGLNRFDAETGRFTRFQHRPDDPHSLSNNTVLALAEDGDGNIWISTDRGLNRLGPDRTRFDRWYPLDLVPSQEQQRLNALAVEPAGVVWVGTYEDGLKRFDPATGRFTGYYKGDVNQGGFPSNRVVSLYLDEAQQLWIGTYDGGLTVLRDIQADPIRARFETYQIKHGLPNDTIFGIEGDDQGYLWISTDRGLCRFDPVEKTFRNYAPKDGLQGFGFLPRATAVSADGWLYFGGNRGLNRFLPEKVHNNRHEPPVHITYFRSDFDQQPSTPYLEPDSVAEVRPGENVVLFKYIALDYAAPNKNRYAYRLDPFDDDWVEVGARTEATYTNLRPGAYTFRVKACNDDGIWNENGAAFRLVVLTPWWRSPLAFAGYSGLALLLLTGLWHLQKQKLERAQEVNQSLVQLDHLKDEFLAGTSHELRTPLNGMIGIVESLLDGVAGPLSDKARADLKMVRSSGRRLVSLVSDIMDFARIKNNSLELNPRSLDLRAATDVVMTLMHPLVGGKNVKLVNEVSPNLPPVRADENRLQQILINLVGNGLKFTESGEVRVGARKMAGKIEIYVEDTGLGMSQARIETIFDTIEHSTLPGRRVRYGGSLGLSITKQLIEIHGGAVTVKSSEGEGTRVVFTLPVGEAGTGFFPENEGDGDTAAGAVMPVPDHPLRDAPVAQGAEANQRFHILIVEDETLNRQVMANHLAVMGYRVTEMATGREVLRAIEQGRRFDLVLLDVVMPRISGYEVCRRIRKRYAVQDLPVIFLAAKHQISDVVAGFESGGNDYITKPVSKDELVSRINTHTRLLDIHRNLEQMVKERTRELAFRNTELESLDDIVQAVNREMEMGQVLETLLNQSLQLLAEAEHAVFLMWEPGLNLYQFAAATGYPLAPLQRHSLSRDALVDHDLRPLDAVSDGIFPVTDCDRLKVVQILREFIPPRSMLVMTVPASHKLEGVLILVNAQQENAFDRAAAKRLNRFREHALAAISKARVLAELRNKNEAIVAKSEELEQKNNELEEAYAKLEDVSLTDPLTGLRNRRFLVKYIYRDVHKVLRDYADGPEPVGGDDKDLIFLLLDLDHFKAVNDNHGHAAGDKVLWQFAEVLKDVCRGSDVIVRWGGEEFLVVSRFTHRRFATDVAERIRSAVAAHHFDLGDGQTIHRTCSIGFACVPFLPEAPGSLKWEQVIDLADQALYVVKRSGRNGWLGMRAGEGPHDGDLFKRVRDDLPGCVARGEIVLDSSLARDQLDL